MGLRSTTAAALISTLRPGIIIDPFCGHGGLFKQIAQQFGASSFLLAADCDLDVLGRLKLDIEHASSYPVDFVYCNALACRAFSQNLIGIISNHLNIDSKMIDITELTLGVTEAILLRIGKANRKQLKPPKIAPLAIPIVKPITNPYFIFVRQLTSC
ncbi:hypothetical protein Ciccas_005633 [Cichlidogyrus casuarinus]|uniref:Uncharacterized protein n=1 Tax=Cichlidogyrus casuarinus TaxID=1844966 RepID=A0ABD2QAG5_9PLAT